MRRTEPDYRQYLIGGPHHGEDKLDLLPGNQNDRIRFPKPVSLDLFRFGVNDPITLSDTEDYRRERMSIFGVPITVWLSESDLSYSSFNWQVVAGEHVGRILLRPHTRPDVTFGSRR